MSESLEYNGMESVDASAATKDQARIREQARIRQRRRHPTIKRIDYHPDIHALQIIDSLRTKSVGGDASSIINRIIRQWQM